MSLRGFNSYRGHHSNKKGRDALQKKPQIGNIVHYMRYGSPNGEHKAEPSPAIVTQVFDGTDEVQLFVINPNGLYFNRTKYAAVPTPGHWSWPPGNAPFVIDPNDLLR
jgi:hypothetical protein